MRDCISPILSCCREWMLFLAAPLAFVLAGCNSIPPAQLTGGVYDGQAQGLGFVEFDLSQLGNATTAPATFRYSWDLPSAPSSPIQEVSAVLPRVATVRQLALQINYAHADEEFATKADADYFVFDDDSTFHRAVSNVLRDAAQKFVADFRDNWEDSLRNPDPEYPTHRLKTLTKPVDPSEDRQSADLVCCTTNLVSVEVYPRSWPGDPQPAILHNFFNDGGQAQPFTEAELFRPHSGWEKKLSDLCLAQFLKDKATYVADGTVTSFTPEQLTRFTVTPAGLRIYFYSMEVELGGGDTTVDIPWADLRGYLNPDGPARFLTSLPPPIAVK